MEGYVSIKQVLDNILDHPMLQNVTLERAINHAVNFMRIVGCPDIFVEKAAIVDIDNYRGKLPDNFYEIVQVRTFDNDRHCHSTFNDNCTDRNRHYRVFRYTTDSFHMSKRKQESFDLTYKLQGNCIFTSIKEGKIEIIYRAFATDCNGYPMLPDNSSFITALEYYIKKKQFTVLFDLGKINQQVLQQACQDYAWAVGRAQSDLIRPSIDQMESITNMWNTLIPRVSGHRSGFVDSGTKERIRMQ